MNLRAPTIHRLLGVVLVLTVAASASAAQGPRLEGTLADPATALLVRPDFVATVPVAAGRLSVTAGPARTLSDLRQHGTALTLQGQGLSPGARYLLLAGERPVVSFTTDATGQVAARYLAGPARAGWQPLPQAVAKQLEGTPGPLRVIPLSEGGRSHVIGPSGAKDDLPQTVTYAETPLCSPDGAAAGQVWVSEVEGYSYLAALGFGLEPLAEYTLQANGVVIGAVAADDSGFLFVDADAGEPLPGTLGAMLDLPAGLLPVSVIASVELVTSSGAVALAGDFTDPCVEQPPLPIAAGSIMLCDPDGGGGNPMSWRSGAFDWLELDGGLEMAILWAFGLDPDTTLIVTLDEVEVGTVTVDAGGSLVVAFSTEPGPGELQLPSAVLPLSELVQVDLETGGQTVLAGTAGVPCDPPPAPVNRGDTPLCPAEGWSRGGWASWQVWDSGDEDLSVWTWGLEPAATYELTADDVLLGTFAADDWGSLGLVFATYPGPGQLPLPDTIRPVSAIDAVTVTLAGAPALAGSFSAPCEPPPPPVPVDFASTQLCPDDGVPGWGDASWEVWDEGTERLMVSAWWDSLEPDTEVQLVVDGHDLGTFTPEAWDPGFAFLSLVFSSDPLPGELPLPAEVRPLSAIDRVELLVEGQVVLQGSFAAPCGPPPPPTPVESGITHLCPEQPQLTEGDVLWTVYDDGLEELFVSAWGLDEATAYNLTIDGVDLGSFTPEPGGFLFLAFSSEPQWSGQLQLPSELSPVSGIDVVEVSDPASVVILAGSFADPCTSVVVWEGNTTGLCAADGEMRGLVSWWTASVGTTVLEEQLDVMVWDAPPGVSRTVSVDGRSVGSLEPMPGWPGALLLSLGTSSAAPIPPELHPLSGIDEVSVYEAGAGLVLDGSFSAPCGVDPLAGTAGAPHQFREGPIRR